MSKAFWAGRAATLETAWLECLDVAETPIPRPDNMEAFDTLVARAAQGEFGQTAFDSLKRLCENIPMYDVTAAIDGFSQSPTACRAFGPILQTFFSSNNDAS